MAFNKTFRKRKVSKPSIKTRLNIRRDAAKVKSDIKSLQHKNKLEKLERQKQINTLKAEARAAKPKNVQRRANREFELKKLEARREVDVINAKNKWKNTLAAGVTGTSTIDAIKNDDGKSIQSEIENALAGPTQPSTQK